MKESGFFDAVTQVKVPWRDTTVGAPLFYQDVRLMTALLLAPLGKVGALLPSRRLHPLRVTPWHTLVLIAAYEYRACDIGPYNEVAIGTPVTLDRPSPLFSGLFRPAPAEPDLYLFDLPVTTEIACTLGIEVGGYPKFLADIEFKDEGEATSCTLSESGQHILTLTVRRRQTRPIPRSRTHVINVRDGRLLRSLCVVSEREESSSKKQGDARLELGDHRIAQRMGDWHLGRMSLCQYTPRMQMILTPVLESFTV